VARIALLALTVSLMAATSAEAQDRFPPGFLWGTASAGFQVEAGGSPSNADRRSDWWRFTHDAGLIRDGVVSGDRVERGPGFWRTWRADLDRARGDLDNNAIRLGIEWSRIFPRSTARVRTGTSVSTRELRRLHRLADRRAVRRYAAILRGARQRGLRVMLTLNHFTLPLWVHDPIAVRKAFAGRGVDDSVPGGLRRAGWLQRSTVTEFRKFAAYAAWRFGRDVDLWVTLNEPLVTASQGFASIAGVTGVKAPAVLSYPAVIRSLETMGLANAAAYDAIRARDRGARVGPVVNLLDWRPADATRPADVTAAQHADQIYNRSFLDIAVEGWFDLDVDGVRDAGEVRPSLARKADFVGVNHYSPAYAQALGAPVSPTVPLFDFLPQIAYRGTGNPNGSPCPATCSDFGWLIDPAGLANVVKLAAGYGRPVYVTENGIDDAGDAQRAEYLRGYLQALHGAIADGTDVRGYFHWSLLDNFEWAEGFHAKFGLYAYDPRTLARRARPSASVFARAARTNAVP
jgi:beta-glucosidase/6-phospho-beta-glucosidase/beta-galactosidase